MSTPIGDLPACAATRAALILQRGAEYQVLQAVAALDAGGAATDTGYRSTRRLLEDLAHLDPAAARRLITQAALLCPRTTLTGDQLAPALPATAAAKADGLLDDGHLRVIAATMERLARLPQLEPDAFAHAETFLAEHATRLSPAGLQQAARRLEATLDPDGTAPPDEPEPIDEFRFQHRSDGTLALAGTIQGRADAELVKEVFDRLSAPAGPDDTRTLAQRQAEVLLDLCAQAASPTGIAAPPTDTDTDGMSRGDGAHRPEHDEHDESGESGESGESEAADDPADPRASGQEPADTASATGNSQVPPALAGPAARTARSATGTARTPGCPTVPVLGRALLAVTIDAQWLARQIGHATLDSGHALDPTTARRTACDAGVVPILLGSRSEPLDIGRMSYTVTDAIRRALHQRDRGCSFPGCTRRPARCHAHHILHWVDGGLTELRNLTLLCRFHHHVIHHEQWQIEMREQRPWFIPPPFIDPTRTPLPGGVPTLAG